MRDQKEDESEIDMDDAAVGAFLHLLLMLLPLMLRPLAPQQKPKQQKKQKLQQQQHLGQFHLHLHFANSFVIFHLHFFILIFILAWPQALMTFTITAVLDSYICSAFALLLCHSDVGYFTEGRTKESSKAA